MLYKTQQLYLYGQLLFKTIFFQENTSLDMLKTSPCNELEQTTLNTVSDFIGMQYIKEQ
jgi:hypothetical protein